MTREELGIQLQKRRLEKGYTIRELADLCELNKENIQRIEAGKYSVRFDILTKVCKALELKIELKKYLNS